MVSLALHPDSRTADQVCVWAEAGLLAYKLCDRGFDCEHCPLDAALRGVEAIPDPYGHGHPAHAPVITFPNDRFYSRTHTWLMPDHARVRARIGLDGFAAALIAALRQVRQSPGVEGLRKGQTLCTLALDDGLLPLCAPVSGGIAAWNTQLAEDPSLVIADPYSRGWIAELTLGATRDLAGLLSSTAAQRQARFDDRRLRRRIAFELLADADAPTGGLTADIAFDLRHVLGAVRYVSILRELVH